MQTGCFMKGGSAPTGRHGEMRRLTEALCKWAREGLPGVAKIVQSEDARSVPVSE